MGYKILDKMKHKIVLSITSALSEKKDTYSSKDKIIKNARHTDKIDGIHNKIIEMVKSEKTFDYIILNRRGYKIPLYYDKINKNIYSFHSMKRLDDFLREKEKENNYFYGLIKFNNKSEKKIGQVSIKDYYGYENFNEVLERDYKSIEYLKEEIFQLLKGLKPENHIVIGYEIDQYRLINVNIFYITTDLERIKLDDWTNFIEMDYDEINSYENMHILEEEDDIDLGITLKDDVKENIEKDEDNNEDKYEKKLIDIKDASKSSNREDLFKDVDMSKDDIKKERIDKNSNEYDDKNKKINKK